MKAERTKPSVLVALRGRESFLRHFKQQGDRATLFVPGYDHLVSGCDIEIEVAFSEPPMTFASRGVVRWKRTKASASLPAGIGVEFLPEEAGTLELMVRFSRGEPIPELHPRARRFPAEVEVEFMLGGARMRANTQNISQTGAFISTSQTVEVNDVLPLRVLEARNDFAVDTEVRWIRPGPCAGMGVRFLIDQSATAHHVYGLVEDVRQAMASGGAKL